MEAILQLRQNWNNACRFVCDCVLRCVTAKMKWRSKLGKNLAVSEVVTVSDKAFGLLVLENGWEKWKTQHERQTCDQKTKRETKSKCTVDKREGNSSFDGWKAEGLNRCNDLCCRVIVDCKTQGGKEFDSNHKTDLKKACTDDADKKRRSEWEEEGKARSAAELHDPSAETNDQFEKRMEQIMNGGSGELNHETGDIEPDRGIQLERAAGAPCGECDSMHDTEVC